MTIYWLAMAELLYKRSYGGILPFHKLTKECKAVWVDRAKEASKSP